MNKHTQNLEEQIKALSIQNAKLKNELEDANESSVVVKRLNDELRDAQMQYEMLEDRKDDEIDELEGLLSEATRYFVFSIVIGFVLLIGNIIQFIINL